MLVLCAQRIEILVRTILERRFRVQSRSSVYSLCAAVGCWGRGVRVEPAVPPASVVGRAGGLRLRLRLRIVFWCPPVSFFLQLLAQIFCFQLFVFADLHSVLVRNPSFSPGQDVCCVSLTGEVRQYCDRFITAILVVESVLEFVVGSCARELTHTSCGEGVEVRLCDESVALGVDI